MGWTNLTTFEKVRHLVHLVGEVRYHWEAGVDRPETEVLLRPVLHFVAEVGRHLERTAYMDESPAEMVETAEELDLADVAMTIVRGDLRGGGMGRRYLTGLMRKGRMTDFGTSSKCPLLRV